MGAPLDILAIPLRILGHLNDVSFGWQVKLALCQILVGDDKTKNIAHAREAVAKAAKEGANIVALPGEFSTNHLSACVNLADG